MIKLKRKIGLNIKNLSKEIDLLFLAPALLLIILTILFNLLNGPRNNIQTVSQDQIGTQTKADLIEKKSLPFGFPADFPLIPGLEIENSWTSESDSILAMTVVFLTDESTKKVVNYYKLKLVDNGFKTSLVSEKEDSAVISFEKENLKGFVGISSNVNKTYLSVSVGLKKI